MVQGATRIQIPPRFNEILGDSALGNSLRLYVQRFDAWVGDDTKGLFFFPEYTDHGPLHITSVLFGAEALIREEAWKAVTREDVVVFVAATLFHDAAMHLTADGFLSLIDPARTGERPLVRLLDNTTWPELFAAYYSEARKWDQRRLHRILGDEAVQQEEEPDLMDSVRRPEDVPNPETWTVRYRKFLGEFVRRHHARLAHEIAFYGYPGHTPDTLRLPTELASFADLAGLVARSHNMHLRDTFDYLQQKHWGRLTCQNAHPVFLMVLLRIADYLEVRSDRVNSTALAIQRLRSPISVEEQSSHLAVHEVRPDEHDEEAIFVIARPPSARLFLKLQSLLKGLQSELDTSWAVLGEVYSKQSNLSCFGIRLRRVRSNLDAPEEYLRREEPPYFPIHAAFDTTGADLLKLLIRPLYGDRPEIGIRELLQNALDAVHELRQWAADHGDPEMEEIPLPDQEADILISIDKDKVGETWLTVRDKGIGMTVDVVRHYFLKAGASYRNSTIWREKFEDEAGSRVLRSGRFGIGALAAFLLGERIEVYSRHVGEDLDSGVAFSASIADDIIELRRVHLPEVGSTIRIKLSPSALEDLQWLDGWDWYALDNPTVQRRYLGEFLEQGFVLPAPKERSRAGWSEIPQQEYESVIWGFGSAAPPLVCNGIRVLLKDHRKRWEKMGVPFGAPDMFVWDRGGVLPLNLQRNDLVTSGTPCNAETMRRLSLELIAFHLVHAPENDINFGGGLKWSHWPDFFSGYRSQFRTDRLWPFGLTDQGTILVHPWYLKKMKTKFCLCFSVNDEGAMASLPFSAILKLNALVVVQRAKFSDRFQESTMLSRGHARRFLSKFPLAESGSRTTGLSEGGGDWEIRGHTETSNCLLEQLQEIFAGTKPQGLNAVIEFSFSEHINVAESPFTKTLDEVLDSPVVPLDPEERRHRLAKTFSRLEEYLDAWQPENLGGWRLDLVRWSRGESEPNWRERRRRKS